MSRGLGYWPANRNPETSMPLSCVSSSDPCDDSPNLIALDSLLAEALVVQALEAQPHRCSADRDGADAHSHMHIAIRSIGQQSHQQPHRTLVGAAACLLWSR